MPSESGSPRDMRDLLGRIRELDDRDALWELLAHDLAWLKRRIRSGSIPIVDSAFSASDVANQIALKFEAAARNPTIPDPEALRAYLWRAAKNILFDLMRKSGRRPRLVDVSDVDDAALAIGGRCEDAREDDRMSVRLAVDLLEKAEDREIIVLYDFEQRSMAAIAKQIGIDVGAAKMRHQRALDRLERILERLGATIAGE